jgi:hypothetical protein
MRPSHEKISTDELLSTSHYFVVRAQFVDHGWQFVLDDDLLMARFPEGVMYREDRGWHNGVDGEQASMDEALADALAIGLDAINERLAKHPRPIVERR